MNSRKKTTLIVISIVITLIIGMIIGIAISRPYFNYISKVDLTINRALQAYSYSNDFGKDDPDKAKLHILLDLKFNLSTLNLMRYEATDDMRAHICDKLIKITENKNTLINFEKQVSESNSDTKLEWFIDRFEDCKSW